jgi:hypothetical protein
MEFFLNCNTNSFYFSRKVVQLHKRAGAVNKVKGNGRNRRHKCNKTQEKMTDSQGSEPTSIAPRFISGGFAFPSRLHVYLRDRLVDELLPRIPFAKRQVISRMNRHKAILKSSHKLVVI